MDCPAHSAGFARDRNHYGTGGSCALRPTQRVRTNRDANHDKRETKHTYRTHIHTLRATNQAGAYMTAMYNQPQLQTRTNNHPTK